MNAQSLISKVWSFCHMLRDDGVGYGDYLEQLTYLIFLKLADEYDRSPSGNRHPPLYDWDSPKRLQQHEAYRENCREFLNGWRRQEIETP